MSRVIRAGVILTTQKIVNRVTNDPKDKMKKKKKISFFGKKIFFAFENFESSKSPPKRGQKWAKKAQNQGFWAKFQIFGKNPKFSKAKKFFLPKRKKKKLFLILFFGPKRDGFTIFWVVRLTSDLITGVILT